jgi:hypothetical protein
MSIYCLCEAQPGTKGAHKPDAQVFGAANRYCSILDADGKELDPGGKFPPVALQQPMRMIAVGARQVVFHGQHGRLLNLWEGGDRPRGYGHYPNVDVYECPTCKARVVYDGWKPRPAGEEVPS